MQYRNRNLLCKYDRNATQIHTCVAVIAHKTVVLSVSSKKHFCYAKCKY